MIIAKLCCYTNEVVFIVRAMFPMFILLSKKIGSMGIHPCSSLSQEEAWSKGVVTASAQNFARQLMETPSNMMTPTMFVESVTKRLGEVQQTTSGKLEVIPR